MRIIRRRHYLNSLKSILLYIAKDKQGAAHHLKSGLDRKLEQLLDFPKMYQQSIYHDDENYRNMVFNLPFGGIPCLLI